jgi:O-antigen/teichoic acid export membrane protein
VDSKPTILLGVSKIFSAKLFVLVLSALSVYFLANALGAEKRGDLAAILVFPTLLIALTEGGMRQSAIRFIGAKAAPEEQVVCALFIYIIFSGFAGFAVAFLFLHYWGNYNASIYVALVAALFVPVTLAVNALHGYFLGRQDVTSYGRLLWIQKLIYLTCIAVLYIWNALTVFTAVVALVGAAFFNLLQALYYLLPSLKGRLSFDYDLMVKMLKLGILYAVALFVIQANYKIDILLLSFLSSSTETGNYAVAVQIGELLWQLPSAVLLMIMTKAAADESKMAVNVAKTVRMTLFVTLLMAFLLNAASFLWVEKLFGSEFSVVPVIILTLSPGLVFAAVYKTINGYYAGKGNPIIAIKVMGVAVIINIVLNYIFIPSLGGQGAALSSTLSYIFAAAVYLFLFCNAEGISPKEVLVVRISDFRDAQSIFRKLIR